MKKVLAVLGVGLLLLSGCGSKQIAPAHRDSRDFDLLYERYELGGLADKAVAEKINVAIANCIPAVGGVYIDIVVFASRKASPSVTREELSDVARSLASYIESDPNHWLLVRDESMDAVTLKPPVIQEPYWFPLPIPPSMPESVMWGPSTIVPTDEYDVVVQTVRCKGWKPKYTCSFATSINENPPTMIPRRRLNFID